MGNDVRDLVGTHGSLNNLAEFVGSLISVDLMGLVSTFDVVKESEMLSSLIRGDNIHETTWESFVSSDSVIDLDETFGVFHNLGNFGSVQSILKSVLKEKSNRNALSELVGSA